MMGPIVLYTHTTNQEDPQSRFEEKTKKHLTDGQNDRMKDGENDKWMDKGQFI